jgi:hypothetical protein
MTYFPQSTPTSALESSGDDAAGESRLSLIYPRPTWSSLREDGPYFNNVTIV